METVARWAVVWLVVMMGATSGMLALWKVDSDAPVSATYLVDVHGLGQQLDAQAADQLQGLAEARGIEVARVVPRPFDELLAYTTYVAGSERDSLTESAFQEVFRLGNQQITPLTGGEQLPSSGEYYLTGDRADADATAELFDSMGLNTRVAQQRTSFTVEHFAIEVLLGYGLLVVVAGCLVVRLVMLVQHRRAMSAMLLMGHSRSSIGWAYVCGDAIAAAAAGVAVAAGLLLASVLGWVNLPGAVWGAVLCSVLCAVVVFAVVSWLWVVGLLRGDVLATLKGSVPQNVLPGALVTMRVSMGVVLVIIGFVTQAQFTDSAALRAAAPAWQKMSETVAITLSGLGQKSEKEEHKMYLEVAERVQQRSIQGDILYIRYDETMMQQGLEHMPNTPVVWVNREYLKHFEVSSVAGRIDPDHDPEKVIALMPPSVGEHREAFENAMYQSVVGEAELADREAPEVVYADAQPGQQLFVSQWSGSLHPRNGVSTDPIVIITPDPQQPLLAPTQWMSAISYAGVLFMNPDRDVTADFLGEFSDVLGSQHSPAADAAYETSSTFQGTFHMVVQLLLYVGVFVLLALTSAWVFGLARSREVFVRRMHGSSWWQIMRVPLWFELGFTVALIAAVWLIASRDEMMVPMIRWDEGRDGTVVALLIGAAAAASVFWAGQSVFRTQRSNHT